MDRRDALRIARQEQGYAALHEAARKGDREMAQMLLDHGADPRAKNDGGKTPVNVAEENGQTAFAEWLRTRQKAEGRRQKEKA